MQVHQFLGTFFTNLAAGCASGCAPPRSADTILHKYPKIDTLIYTNKSANILKWVNESSDKHYHEGWDKAKTYASIVIDKKTYKVVRLYSPSPYALRSVSKEVRREQYDMVFKLE